MTLLNKELNKLNVFFIEKEEEYVIRLQVLLAKNVVLKTLALDALKVIWNVQQFHKNLVWS